MSIISLQSDQSIQPQKSNQSKNRIISIKQLVLAVWNLGLITYGGPMSHIGVLKGVFVQKLKSIDNDRFTELLTICQSLPGPTSTQLLISTSIYSTASLSGGIVSFILFSLPTFITMFITALFLSNVSVDSEWNQILRGFRIVSIAIILQAFWGLSVKYRKQYKSAFLFIFSALTYRLFSSTYTIIILFIIGGFFSFYTPLANQDSQLSNIQVNTSTRFSNCLYGKKNIFIFIILLICSIGASIYYPGAANEQSIKLIQTSSHFYRIGSIIIGGGHVIMPMMWSQFQKYDYFNQQDYWNGFSMISCMPGPMFNLSVYMGTLVTKNIFGALSAFLGLYTPCFLFILFILPHWQIYRQRKKIKRFIDGICCVSVGLILTAALLLFQKQCLSDQNNLNIYCLSLLVLVCFVVLQVRKWNIVIVLGFGQILYLIIIYGLLKIIHE